MNWQELLRKVLTGHLMLAGEVRRAEVKESAYVDKNSGLRVSVWLIHYFVEQLLDNGYLLAKITRRVPRDLADPASYPVGVERGKCYASEVECVEWKNGIRMAWMGSAEPALLDAGEGVADVDAPPGAATDGAPLDLSKYKQLQGP